MKRDLDWTIAVLRRTPPTLRALLTDLPEDLLRSNEGEKTWSPFDILGHLIHGERTDWIPRLRRILEDGESREFEPFDRFAQFTESHGKSLSQLLLEFETLRSKNLQALSSFGIQPADFDRKGRHPDFGAVTLGQLLSSWVVHDLGHIAQATRVMAKQLGGEVGPWHAYLPVLERGPS